MDKSKQLNKGCEICYCPHIKTLNKTFHICSKLNFICDIHKQMTKATINPIIFLVCNFPFTHISSKAKKWKAGKDPDK